MWLFAAFVNVRCSNGDSDTWDPRKAELSQTNGNYALIDVSFDSESKILSFDGFENKFSLLLSLNEDLILGSMQHMIQGKKNHPDLKNSYLSTLTESCHYHIYKEKNDEKFSGAISICPHKGACIKIILIVISLFCFDHFVGVLWLHVFPFFLFPFISMFFYIVFDSFATVCLTIGVRGFINTGDDTIVITPAKRLLDLEYDSNPNKHHEIWHKHLIYKMSQFDNKGYDDAIEMQQLRLRTSNYKRIRINHDDNHNRGYNYHGNIYGVYDKKDPLGLNKMNHDDENPNINDIVKQSKKMKENFKKSTKHNRKLLLENSNYCEFLAIVDPWWYETYYNNYGENYFDNLLSQLSDIVNGMSSLFYQTDWGDSVGTIEVEFVAILVIRSFTGDYASLQPSESDGKTSSDNYLSKLVTWSTSYIPDGYSQSFSATYDAIQIFVGADNFDTG